MHVLMHTTRARLAASLLLAFTKRHILLLMTHSLWTALTTTQWLIDTHAYKSVLNPDVWGIIYVFILGSLIESGTEQGESVYVSTENKHNILLIIVTVVKTRTF